MIQTCKDLLTQLTWLVCGQEVVSSAGSWDNSSRQLSLQLWAPRQLGAKLSGSLQLQGGLWLPSGAAILNFLSVSRLNLKIQFNEVQSSLHIYCFMAK